VYPWSSVVKIFSAFRDIARRVNFLSSEQLVKEYEYEIQTGGSEFRL